MYIERVQVEAEGFLANLDVQFTPGLNVIIGARGTGKTSLIELIRYALNAGAFTADAAAIGNQQALAVLEGGAVTVTVNDSGVQYVITRTSSGHIASSGGRSFPCTVLAQNEVEAVGAQAAGRLHLLDRFRPTREGTGRSLLGLQTEIESLTQELHAAIQEGSLLREQISSLAAVPEELAAAQAEQQSILAASQATEAERSRLLKLQASTETAALEAATIEQAVHASQTLTRTLFAAKGQTEQVLPPASSAKPDVILGPARECLAAIDRHLAAAEKLASQMMGILTEAQHRSAERRHEIDSQGRQLRQLLNSVQAGVGSATRRVAELQEQHGQLIALRKRLSQHTDVFQRLSKQRDGLYEQLDDLRSRIFSERREAADQLNARLLPLVKVSVTRSSSTAEYESAIVEALRGSGLHYNTLARLIVSAVSPLELASWVELGQHIKLANTLDVTPDRAAAIVGALRRSGVSRIVSAGIDDGVTLSLLDGRDYKTSDRLSIGQRCTVVLPVLLGHHGDPLLIDQPEDHLDNAFIASTLVPALRRRTSPDQFIFASHNANIPVLGNADRIIVMDSDGDRGYVRQSGPLDAHEIVQSVTQIMEGGPEAFSARARFYGAQLGPSI